MPAWPRPLSALFSTAAWAEVPACVVAGDWVPAASAAGAAAGEPVAASAAANAPPPATTAVTASTAAHRRRRRPRPVGGSAGPWPWWMFVMPPAWPRRLGRLVALGGRTLGVWLALAEDSRGPDTATPCRSGKLTGIHSWTVVPAPGADRSRA